MSEHTATTRDQGRARTSTSLKFLIVVTGCGWVGCTINPSYVHVSRSLYDSRRILRRDEFDDQHLLTLFRSFVDRECRGRRLARLSVSTNEWDLILAGNSPMPELGPAAQLSHPDSDNAEGAQVWCCDGQATAFIRRGKGSSVHHQLRGDHDARELVFGRFSLTLVGVLLPTSDDSIWLFLRTTVLPDLEGITAIHHDLEQRLDAKIFLVLRTDANFLLYGGPAWDIFSESLPEDWPFGKPHAFCPPTATGGKCELVTEPPRTPAGDWGKK